MQEAILIQQILDGVQHSGDVTIHYMNKHQPEAQQFGGPAIRIMVQVFYEGVSRGAVVLMSYAEFKELTARDSDADFEAWLETEAGKSAIERAALCCATAGSDPSRAIGLVRAEWNGVNSLVRNLR